MTLRSPSLQRSENSSKTLVPSPARWPQGARAKACGNRPFKERPGWGVADLDSTLRPDASGRAPSASDNQVKFGATMFNFGVTYVKNHNVSVTSERVWARSMPGFVWFSTEPDERLRGRMVVLDHCMEPIYSQMTNRMIDVWSHVWTHWHGYSWYMRLWDDNWVDVERMLPAAMKMHAINDSRGYTELAHHGRLVYHQSKMFVGGGASSFLSGAGMRAWMGSPQTLDGMADCVRFLGQRLGRKNPIEDVLLSWCQIRSGIRLYKVIGLSSQGFRTGRNIQSWKNLKEDAVRCRHPFQEVPQELPGPIITMHYMREPQLLEMKRIFRIPCPPDL